MSGRMRSIFHLEESDEDNLTSKCSCIYSDIQTALHDAYDRFETEDDRRLVELTNLVGRNCHELEGCLVIFTWKGEPKAGTLQFNGMSDLSVRDWITTRITCWKSGRTVPSTASTRTCTTCTCSQERRAAIEQ